MAVIRGQGPAPWKMWRRTLDSVASLRGVPLPCSITRSVSSARTPGDHVGGKAAPIAADELDTGRVREYRSGTGEATVLQPGSDGPYPVFQAAVGDVLDLAVQLAGD